MASPLISPVFSWFTSAGLPAVGYKLNTYAAGTSTPQATYTDSTLTTPNTNPVVLNSQGYAPVWLVSGSVYKFVLTDASNNIIWTQDNVSGGSGGLTSLRITGSGATMSNATFMRIGSTGTPTIQWDVLSEWKNNGTSSAQFVCNNSGVYQVNLNVSFATGGGFTQGGLPTPQVLINGTGVIGGQSTWAYDSDITLAASKSFSMFMGGSYLLTAGQSIFAQAICNFSAGSITYNFDLMIAQI